MLKPLADRVIVKFEEEKEQRLPPAAMQLQLLLRVVQERLLLLVH